MYAYPEVIAFSPSLLDNTTVSSLNPYITIQWSEDIVTTQFSDPNQLLQYFTLLNSQNSTVQSVGYTSYNPATHTLTLQASGLTSNTLYRVVLNNGILGSSGRRSALDWTWEFQTSNSALVAPTLISPSNATFQKVFPTLYWNTVPGTGINYLIQIDERFDFGNVTWSTTTSASSITPAGTFIANTQYFWRVQAFTSTATGDWSNIFSFFFGDIKYGDITTNQTYQAPPSFHLERIGWVDGLSNQTSWPADISLTFNSPVASSFANYVTVTKKYVMPRDDDYTTYNEFPVLGVWSTSPDFTQIIFTPTEAITGNMRYMVKIDYKLPDASGAFTFADQPENSAEFYFTGKYHPYYTDIRSVRARLMGLGVDLPDDFVNYYIFLVSMEANARYYGLVELIPWVAPFGDNLTEKIVRDSTDLKSFGVNKWVEVSTIYRLLTAALVDQSYLIGRTRKLEGFEETLTADFIKGIEAAQRVIRAEIEHWSRFLVKHAVPCVATRGAAWFPGLRDFDASIYSVEGHRNPHNNLHHFLPAWNIWSHRGFNSYNWYGR